MTRQSLTKSTQQSNQTQQSSPNLKTSPPSLSADITSSTAGLSQREILQLQQTHGNHYVRRLLAQENTADTDSPDVQMDRQEILNATSNISNQDVVYEQMAHNLAYKDALTPQDVMWLHNHGYEPVSRNAVQGTGGFAMMAFRPLQNEENVNPATTTPLGSPNARNVNMRPVLAFRGTDDDADLIDDTNPAGVGAYQFAVNQGIIQQQMANLFMGQGQIDVTGHSLGGALAQLSAAEYPGLIGRIVTFQSPGIDNQHVEMIRAYNRRNQNDQINATHHRVESDVVSASGAGFAPGTVYEYELDVVDEGGWVGAGAGGAAGGMTGIGLLPGVVGGALGGRALAAHTSMPLATLFNYDSQRRETSSNMLQRPAYDATDGDLENVTVSHDTSGGWAEGARAWAGGLHGGASWRSNYVQVWQRANHHAQANEYELAVDTVLNSNLTALAKMRMMQNLNQMHPDGRAAMEEHVRARHSG